jgi:hypothetical protein
MYVSRSNALSRIKMLRTLLIHILERHRIFEIISYSMRKIQKSMKKIKNHHAVHVAVHVLLVLSCERPLKETSV